MIVNKYSQGGEEVIVQRLLEFVDSQLPDGILVEFGGSRGSDNSNLFVLGEQGRRLILIESDKQRFKFLENSISSHQSISGIFAKVGWNENSLNGDTKILIRILEENKIDPQRVSVVSIDIDSDDAAVFENLGFTPHLAIVEFNPTLPLDSCFRNPDGSTMGNSPGEIIRVGEALGMYVVAVSPTNLIFMKKLYKDKVPEADVALELKEFDLPRFGLGYDGTLIRYSTRGEARVSEIYHNGWNDSFIRQPLPPSLRKMSREVTWVGILHFITTGLLIQPISSLRLIFKFVRQRLKSKLKEIRKAVGS